MNHMDGTDSMEMGMTRRLTMPLCDRTVNTEVSGDYVLPDYQPEIRRLLYVGQTILPPAKYVGSGGAELNGTVDYQVLYVGADGGLYTVPLSAEYDLTVPLEQVGEFDLNEGVTTLATTVGESMTARVSAPRKLSIRSRLRSHVRAYGSMLSEEQYSGAVNPASIQRLREEARNLSVMSGVSDGITVGTEMTGIGEDARVISADAGVFLTELRPEDGGVRASGDVLLKLMIGRENGGVEVLNRKLPFEGEVEMEAMTADCACRVLGTVSDLSVNVEEGRILCDVGILLEARGMRNLPFSYTADLYSTETDSVCEYEDYELPVALKCENRNISQSERIPMEGLNLPEGSTVLDVFGTAQLESCEQIGEKYVLNGQSRYVLLCEKDGEYSTAEINLPLRYETDRADGAPTSFDAVAEVISCRARVDGDTLNLDAELSVVADYMGSESIRALDAVRFGEKLDCRGNRVVVYYPVSGDTAWTVAKKYHVSPDRLSECSAYYLL